jgi:hypothetical protein
MQTIVPSAVLSERAHTEALERAGSFLTRYTAYNDAARVGDWARALAVLEQERALRSVR